MAFGAVSDPLLAAALWTGLGAFALSVLLVFVILAMRLLLLVRLAHERRVAALWQPLFAQCMFEVPAARPALPARDAEVFLRLWCGAEESLLGAARKNLVEFAQRLGAASHVERLLRDGRPAVRLLALVAAGHLGLREQLPTLERLVRQGSAVTSLTAAHAMLRIEPAHGLPRLIAVAARREDWPIAHVANMLGEADPAAVGPLLAAAVRSELRRPRSGPGVARLLRLHAAAHASSLQPAIREILERDADPEHLVAALSVVWDPADLAAVRGQTTHARWTVRAAAARALGRIGSRADAQSLARLLGDSSWWVRYRAAQALASLPGIGPEEIIAIRAGLHDRFALAMLAQVMAERGRERAV